MDALRTAAAQEDDCDELYKVHKVTLKAVDPGGVSSVRGQTVYPLSARREGWEVGPGLPLQKVMRPLIWPCLALFC